MICTGYNSHILNLLDKQMILWKCVLENGTEVLSDFDIPDAKDPWTRLKNYCNNNNLNIIEVRVICPGMPEQTIFKDKNGLDNFFIIRGASKDILDSDDIVFRFMSFGILKDDGNIHVKKFYWPQFALGQSEEIRNLTEENKHLLFKKIKICGDNCSCQTKNKQN